MFKPVPMMRASIVVLKSDERDVLRLLGRLGVLQLTRASVALGSTLQPPPDRRGELVQCDRLTARIQELRKALEINRYSEAGPNSGAQASPVEIPLTRAENDISAMEQAAGKLLNQRQQLAKHAGELAAAERQLADYRGLGIPLGPPDESSFLHFVTGTLPAESFENFQSKIGSAVALLPLPERAGRQPLMAMTTRQGRAVLESALQHAGFQSDALPAVEGATVDTVSDENRREQEQLAAKLTRLDAERQALAERFSQPLAEIENAVENERHLLEAGQNFLHTESAVLLTGWIPIPDRTKLENRLRKTTDGRCVIEVAAPQDLSDKEIPVLLRHPRWLRPFEMLVTAYGLPRYRELEPTLFFAASYVLMFGLMFGDVGHGAMLALGGLAMLLASRKAQTRDLGLLLLFSGGPSMIFGALYGSCFGITAFKKFALWHDPLESDPMTLMCSAIGTGVTLISLGLVLNIINRFRHGDFIGAWLGKFGVAGMLFYWGALAWVTKLAAIKSANLLAPAFLLFLALPVCGWVLKEPLEFFCARRAGLPTEPGASWFAAVAESLVGVLEAMLSFLANTISFVRLAAYAMSHAALLLAVFLLADTLKQLPTAGTFASIAVIVLGNAAVIALEGIIATVQTLRLEYYEFFSKFFSGAGRPFQPFCLQTTTVAATPL